MAKVTRVKIERAAGIRTTKCLFLLFILLGLVSLTKAAFSKKKLIELKEMYQRTKENYQRKKSAWMTTTRNVSDTIGEYAKITDVLTPLVREYEKLFKDSSPLNEVFEMARDFVDKSLALSDKKEEELRVRTEKLEETLRQIEKLINFHEQQQAEL